MKILVCFGTRPEAIKLAPVIYELKRKGFDFRICVTAQHREMLDQALAFFEIVPDYDLDLMKPNQSLNSLSAEILTSIDKVLEREKPDVVLVHGDTTSSSITALAAFHRGIKVGHIEAGLRTYNKASPFPEELNRQLTGRLADFHFPPTEKAKSNLLEEKIPGENILLSGNTIVDALHWGLRKLDSLEDPQIEKIKKKLSSMKKIILVTGHRRENFGRGFQEVCEALIEIVKNYEVEIIFPVHLNPQVRKMVYEKLSEHQSIHLIEPVSYPVMLWLLRKCEFVISDSGGIQEEAPTFRKPVIVTRRFSERMEGVEAGFSVLTGTDKEKIILEAQKILQDPPNLEKQQNPYGDGTAAGKIVSFLENRM